MILEFLQAHTEEQAILTMCAFVALPFAVGISFYMNYRLHKKHPDARPYTWGYFNGWMGVLIWIVLAAFSFILAYESTGWPDTDSFDDRGFLFLILATISAGFIFRNKWWAIAAIIIQFNPITWIINAVYLENRWHEMSNIPNVSVLNPLRGQSKAIRTIAAASIFWVIVASAFMFLFDSYGLGLRGWRYIDWAHFLKVLIFPPLVIAFGYFLYKKLLTEE